MGRGGEGRGKGKGREGKGRVTPPPNLQTDDRRAAHRSATTISGQTDQRNAVRNSTHEHYPDIIMERK